MWHSVCSPAGGGAQLKLSLIVPTLFAGSIASVMLGCSAQSDDGDTEQAASALKGLPEQIRLKGTGLCIDRAYGGVEPTTEVILYACHGNDNQRWSRQFGSLLFVTHFATYMNDIPFRCLTANAPSQPVSIMPCQTFATQWRYSKGETLTAGGKCLAARSATSAARVVWNDCDGSALQEWEFLG